MESQPGIGDSAAPAPPTLDPRPWKAPETVSPDLLRGGPDAKSTSFRVGTRVPARNVMHTASHLYGRATPQSRGPSPARVLVTRGGPAVFQNGVISLIDCTLLEDPESTEEEGRAGGRTRARGHGRPHRLSPTPDLPCRGGRPALGPREAGPAVGGPWSASMFLPHSSGPLSGWRLSVWGHCALPSTSTGVTHGSTEHPHAQVCGRHAREAGEALGLLCALVGSAGTCDTSRGGPKGGCPGSGERALWDFPPRHPGGRGHCFRLRGGGGSLVSLDWAKVGPRVPSSLPPPPGHRTLCLHPSPDWGAPEQG